MHYALCTTVTAYLYTRSNYAKQGHNGAVVSLYANTLKALLTLIETVMMMMKVIIKTQLIYGRTRRYDDVADAADDVDDVDDVA